MKLMSTLIAVGMMLPMGAAAQSLTDTHVLVWQPAGKTPAATYRPRDKASCTKKVDDHRAGKGQPWTKSTCAAVAAKPTATELSAK